MMVGLAVFRRGTRECPYAALPRCSAAGDLGVRAGRKTLVSTVPATCPVSLLLYVGVKLMI